MTADLTPLRDLAEAVRSRLSDGTPRYEHTFTVQVHRRREARRLTISWYGQPREETVRKKIADLLDSEGVDLTLARERIWSCGRAHEDTEAAWSAHEGQDRLVWRCGCGAIEAEGDTCSDRGLAPDDFPSYCSDLSELVLTDSLREDLLADGETFESACRPGEFERCPICGGDGSRLDLIASRFYPCTFCDRKGVFDLDDTADAQAYAAAWVESERLRAEYEAEEQARTRRARRRLP